ncbi:hypothetical protein ACHAWC_000550 [Mediolabrus comicus]
MFQSIGDILELIVNQNWESFRHNVLSSPDIFRHLASAVSSCSQLNGMTLLHAIVKYDPPLEIVARMLNFVLICRLLQIASAGLLFTWPLGRELRRR